ncbi:cilia- and flagella-associated protein 251 [Nilaparvata lugens]|uniref:cilia- and flagella-associated protein 251 n=1 Tax=Nilaparvata lugens TaxID=108931 RepID=UPI00193CAF23|nr:cilia- and flagella-associated protein 251 [Nilaparvata lugens]
MDPLVQVKPEPSDSDDLPVDDIDIDDSRYWSDLRQAMEEEKMPFNFHNALYDGKKEKVLRNDEDEVVMEIKQEEKEEEKEEEAEEGVEDQEEEKEEVVEIKEERVQENDDEEEEDEEGWWWWVGTDDEEEEEEEEEKEDEDKEEGEETTQTPYYKGMNLNPYVKLYRLEDLHRRAVLKNRKSNLDPSGSKSTVRGGGRDAEKQGYNSQSAVIFTTTGDHSQSAVILTTTGDHSQSAVILTTTGDHSQSAVILTTTGDHSQSAVILTTTGDHSQSAVIFKTSGDRSNVSQHNDNSKKEGTAQLNEEYGKNTTTKKLHLFEIHF